MTAVLLVPPFLQFTDLSGAPLAYGKVYTYSAGTSTPKATYTSSTGGTEAANPIVLDSLGQATIWGSGSYKFIIHDSNDALIKTVDNMSSFVASTTAAAGYFQQFSGDGSTTVFTCSQDLGTDEKSIIVFVNNELQAHQTNGTFGSDTGWTKGSGWTIGAGVATASGAISTALTQTSAVTLIQGQAYAVTYTITRSAGSLTPSIGGTAGTARSADGTYSEIIIAGSSQDIAFTGSGFTGTLDNVSITVATIAGNDFQPPANYTINGTSLTFSTAPPTGTNNISVLAPFTLANAASAAAAAAATSETNAAASELLAEDWATKTNGQVASTDYSSKAYAIGGTGVTTTSGKGAAKEWATTTGAAVDTSEYSAKEYAVGTTVSTGSSKLWATKIDGLVQSVDGSSKAWAIGGTGVTTTSGKGAAKEWATTTGGKVDTSEYSAKEYAVGTTAASAKSWAQTTGADVPGGATHDRSAKSWAQEDLAGATLGGSAKDWAQSASLPDGTSKSAKSYAADAAASAVSANSIATGINDTSTTSLAIGTGSKTFTVTAGKLWQNGQYIIAASAADNANYMHGTVTSYSGTTLVTNITDIGGSGTKADWNISLSGTQGTTGATGPSGSVPIAAAGGTADAITADFTPDLTLSDETICMVVAGAANTTTTPTFAPDGLTAHTITKNGGQALVAGDIFGAGHVLMLEYNLANTRWELMNPGVTITAAARTVLDDTTVGAMLTTLGGQPLDSTLTALAGLATGSNKIPYSTGTDTFSQLDLSTSSSLGTSDTTLSTQKAVKSYVDNAIVAAGLTTIASGSLATGSPTVVDITSIPATYRGLVLYVNGASNSVATRALRVLVDTGAGFGSAPATGGSQLTGTSVAAIVSVSPWNEVTQTAAQTSSCVINFPAYQSGPIKQFWGSVNLATTAGSEWPAASTAITVTGYFEASNVAQTTAIQGIRITWNSVGTGVFDGGTYTLYGVN